NDRDNSFRVPCVAEDMMKTTVTPLMTALLSLVMAVAGSAQSQTKPPAFEVASIKPNTSGVPMVALQPAPGGRLNVTNGTLRMLIRFAYNVDDVQISGGPSWMDSDRYDIVAKGEGNATLDQIRVMLQTLLAD